MQNCASCPFGTRCVGTRGPVDSPFVIVGESPGSRELIEGKPFMGPSGKMLNEMLAQAGLDSLNIEPYVINALSCFPSKKEVPIMQQATRACQSRVMDQLKAHPRKVILCLGAAASWSVTNDFDIKITMDRGQIIKTDLAEHGAVLAVHPAFLMRNGGGLPMWKKDLQSAVRLLKDGKGGEWTDPTWSVIRKPSDINLLIKEYHAAPLITGDIETDQLHWYGGRILCVGITKDDGSHVDIIPEDVFYNNLPAMRRLFEGGHWAWHNGMFDITWLRAPQHNIHAKVDEDTMLMSYSLNENKGFHDLDQVAQLWIGAPKHKNMLSQYLPSKKSSYREVPPEVLYKYNAIDLSKQHRVFAPLEEAVNADPHSKKLYYGTLIPAIDPLVRAKLHGVKVDKAVVEENERKHDEELTLLREEINSKWARSALGHDINIGSPKQMQELLYDKMELKIPGTRSTDEDTLIQIQRRYDHPIVNVLLKYREVNKRKGTYVSNLLRKKDGKNFLPGHIKPDGCIYPDFKLHGTTTGRLAGADPNLLNQPRGPLVRGQYVARPGKLFVEVDLNQAELRSLAIMSGDPTLLEIYTKNEVSIHDVTTGAFYAPKHLVLEGGEHCERVRHMLHLSASMPPKDVYGEAKMRGKAVNFGIVYGREAFSLAVEFNISVKEADRWIKKWFETYPGAAAFIEWCRARPMHKKDIITMFGRKKRHGLIAREKLKALQNEAANFPHQSTASDIMLQTLIRCEPTLREKYKGFVWNEVYDAIYYEIDANEDQVAESIKYIQDVITSIPPEYGLTRVPFLGDAKIGYTWGSMKDWQGSIQATLG